MSLSNLNDRISQIWDNNLLVRVQDIENGTDTTYKDVIVPWALKNIENNCSNNVSIIDIGCGCGYLTNLIFLQGFKKIEGIDISKNSIVYARKKYPHLKFVHKNIFDLSAERKYDFGIAVMTLNNISNAEQFFHALYGILKDDGKAMIIIPHPCFWPVKHIKNNFVSYLLEKSYEIKFSTKGRKDYPSNIIYFHRPLEKYFEYIEKSGFSITTVNELNENDCKNVPDLIGIVIQKNMLTDL